MALDVSLLGVTARMTPGIAAEKPPTPKPSTPIAANSSARSDRTAANRANPPPTTTALEAMSRGVGGRDRPGRQQRASPGPSKLVTPAIAAGDGWKQRRTFFDSLCRDLAISMSMLAPAPPRNEVLARLPPATRLGMSAFGLHRCPAAGQVQVVDAEVKISSARAQVSYSSLPSAVNHQDGTARLKTPARKATARPVAVSTCSLRSAWSMRRTRNRTRGCRWLR